MKDIVSEAKEQLENETLDRTGKSRKQETSNDSEIGNPNIFVVGCGGAGNNTINRLQNIGIEGAETIALNTDKQHLEQVDADTKILVGKELTEGLGAGGDPNVGKRATEEAENIVYEALDGADLVFVTAGMGGGTGTGAAPVVSKIAKENHDAIVVSMVSMPFELEKARLDKAKQGITMLSEAADSVIVLDNNKLSDFAGDLPVNQAFSVMDQLIAQTVKGISETITKPSFINLDYADIKNIMSDGDLSVMLVGELEDKRTTVDKTKVVNEAKNHPLLDADYRGAKGSLVHITGGPELTLEESEQIAEELTNDVADQADVMWGARIKDEFENKIRVMAIMTGIDGRDLINQYTQPRSFDDDENVDVIR